MNCLEEIEVVLLSPAPSFLEPLDHPGTAKLRGNSLCELLSFLEIALCCSKVADPALSVSVAVSDP